MRQFSLIKLSIILLLNGPLINSNAKANESLTIYLSGMIKDKCVIESELGKPLDFSQTIMYKTNLHVDCNQKMSLSIRSDSGGLKLQGQNNILVDYNVKIEFNTLSFKVNKNASEIMSEHRFNAGNAIPFKTDGILRISLLDNFKHSGKYLDTLHIDVYPNIFNNED
ncbi:MAG: hypothetical protein ACJA2G_001930 [Cognaticolwellia sp.]|jgi:hypothetical protein